MTALDCSLLVNLLPLAPLAYTWGRLVRIRPVLSCRY